MIGVGKTKELEVLVALRNDDVVIPISHSYPAA